MEWKAGRVGQKIFLCVCVEVGGIRAELCTEWKDPRKGKKSMMWEAQGLEVRRSGERSEDRRQGAGRWEMWASRMHKTRPQSCHGQCSMSRVDHGSRPSL